MSPVSRSLAFIMRPKVQAVNKSSRGKRGSKKEKVELHTEDQAPASDMEEVGDVPVEKVAAATQGSSKGMSSPIIFSSQFILLTSHSSRGAPGSFERETSSACGPSSAPPDPA